MSHNYFRAVVPIKTKDGAIIKAVADDAGNEWNGESECYMRDKVLAMHIRFAKGNFTEKEAEDYINNIMSTTDEFYWGGYVLAVPFCKTKPSKKIEDYDRRISETREKMAKYIAEHRVGDYKAAFVACPECQSKINKTYFEKNKTRSRQDLCPVCNANMASETTKNTIQGYKDKIAKLEKEKEDEIKKQSKEPTHYLAYAGVHS